jgi:hypothetical protein
VSELTSPAKTTRRFGPRWWLFAGLVFAGLNLLIAPFSVLLLWGMAVAASESMWSAPQFWIPVLVTLIIPAMLGFWLAGILEDQATKSRGMDRAKRWSWRTLVTACAFVSPFAIHPLAAIAVLRIFEPPAEREALERIERRPIAESDTVGFCSAPNWTVHDGHPVLKVAVRVPEKAIYRLWAQGRFSSRERPVGGQTERELDRGVDTMFVTLRNEDEVEDPIEWPVEVYLVELSRNGGRDWIDRRFGDSLYVIDGAGVRVGGRRH